MTPSISLMVLYRKIGIEHISNICLDITPYNYVVELTINSATIINVMIHERPLKIENELPCSADTVKNFV